MESEQLDRLVALARAAVGADLIGAYLFGSAVEGGLKPASDIDLLVVSARRTTPSQRDALIDGLRPLSARDVRPDAFRPVELTVVALPDIVPWRYPPRVDFQSGEWLRDRFEAGKKRPWRTPSPDLTIVIVQARGTSQALIGPPAADLLPEAAVADLGRAMTAEIHSLLDDLDTDTANVLLTLMRIWHTLATGHFVPKDKAADWALERLGDDPGGVLTRARDVYLGHAPGSWAEQEAWADELPAARSATRLIVGRIEGFSGRTYNRHQ